MISQVNYVGVDGQQFRHSSTSHIHLEQQRNESMQHPQPQHLEYYGSQQHGAQQSFQADQLQPFYEFTGAGGQLCYTPVQKNKDERVALSGPPFVSLAPSGEFTDGNFINASEALPQHMQYLYHPKYLQQQYANSHLTSAPFPPTSSIFNPSLNDNCWDSTYAQVEVKLALRNQIEYYFSQENVSHDTYLRSLMDHDGYVSIAEIAKFNRVRRLLYLYSISIGADISVKTYDLKLLLDIAASSPYIEVSYARSSEGRDASPGHIRAHSRPMH